MTRGSARRGAALASAGLMIALLPTGGAEAQDAEAQDTGTQARTRAASAAHTVTLVTGDKVTVTDLGGGRKTVTVERPRGATGAVRTQTANGAVTVVPDEALPHLRAGTLDQRLFDVSELIRQGLTDRKTGELPLIVTYEKGARVATPRGAERTRGLPSVHGAAVDADKGRTFWRALTRQDGIDKVWLDGRVRADMAESNAQIGTPEAWEAGLTGKGVTVAVLDTGVDVGHPDLDGRVSATRSFIEGEEVADRNGHGTHVTSTVGGSGAASGGKEKGVAPGATLAVGKVLSDQGSGSESQIIAGMEWAARDVGAEVVSMSLGSTEPSDGTDPMAQAVETLSKETGALFVVAAGNTGAPSSIGSPGAADSALTVGAVDSADEAAYFTSAGPRYGDNALKPDLSAPGVDILAARSRLAVGSGDYTAMSGTSMATPHVAGVAALLAERHPDWTGAQLKNALMSTSKQLDASAYVLGSGRVSVPEAVKASVTATGSADLGFYQWPYESNEPVTRTVTYTNSSDTAVELSLAVRGAPEGVATLADSMLTVPAHGAASTTVTGDGGKAPVGNTSGQIVASAADGATVAHTAFGLVKEEERYTLTVHVKDRAGDATAADLVVQRLAEGVDPFPAPVGDSGTVELRLKPGTYSLNTFLDVRGSRGADSLGLGFLAAPEIDLDRDREITLDGRRLREVAARVDRRTETRQLLMEYDRAANGSDLFGAVQVPVRYDSVFAAPTAKVTKGSFEYRTVWRLGKPMLEVKGVGEAVVQPGSTLVEGRRKLPLVDVGTGEYGGKDVRGKAVLVRMREGAEPAAIAQAAQDAGAEALFVTDDVPGRLNAWFGTDDNADRPIQIATVNTADAARLRAAKRAETNGTRNTPYTYDLSEGHRGSIPARDLTYEPSRGQLAVLDTRFHAVKPVSGSEFRYSLTDDSFPMGIGFQERIDFPAERTEYVSTGSGQLWHESVNVGAGDLEERSGLVRYRGGTRPDLDWFRPVWQPWLGSGLGWGQQRAGGQLQFNTPGWGDSGPDHTGFGNVWSDETGMTQFTEVYLDGELVDRRMSSGVYVSDAPADEHTYKVVTDTTLDADRWKLSTKGHSEWTFRSAATPEDRWTVLPLLNLGFDVDTDLAGNVRGGSRLPVGIHSSYVAGATDTGATGTIGGGKLEVSYDDGKSWRTVRLSGSGSGSGEAEWKGTVTVPRGAEYVSLRASASDDRGGSVTQEIVRAVGVR
ncbi:subtilisin family serine protease [Streptomyces umbrinus]|uniref:Subtilisin family serine protease n=1 Tax=Streptomyces umbrinus TaxID=67370 RepID=A0ABU0T3G4_9ACTN|nr:S8 family serine peptidase [Streptomyces umbrinus]MDQ1029516.1 subtilisin family serine protease [Streptomyces umbrinus]